MSDKLKHKLGRVLIAEDHPLVQVSLTELVHNINPEAEIITTTMSVRLVATVKEKMPDLLLLDVLLEDGVSLNNIDVLKGINPAMKILIVSTMSDETYGKRSLHLGADGFIDKKSSLEEMRNAIISVMNDQKYLSNDIMYKLAFSKHDVSYSSSPFEALTNREYDIMMLMLEGKTMADISNTVNLQRSTVSTHKMKMMSKLSVKNLLELQALAIKYNVRKTN